VKNIGESESPLESMSLDELRRYSEELIAESIPKRSIDRRPIKIASFEC
jgi:hypothetical protein